MFKKITKNKGLIYDIFPPEKIQKATEGWFKYLSPSGEKIV